MGYYLVNKICRKNAFRVEIIFLVIYFSAHLQSFAFPFCFYKKYYKSSSKTICYYSFLGNYIINTKDSSNTTIKVNSIMVYNWNYTQLHALVNNK